MSVILFSVLYVYFKFFMINKKKKEKESLGMVFDAFH